MEQQCFRAVAGEMQPIGGVLDASVISDDGGRGEHASFGGAFVGMLAHDMTGKGWTAGFLEFDHVLG